jgi:hypothetical protein
MPKDYHRLRKDHQMKPASTPASPSARPGTLVGTLLCRLVVPGWIVAGAGFKLWERNPQLLPKPVTDVTDFVFVKTLGIPRESYLDPALRGMVAIEIAAAMLMFAGPIQASRAIGVGMLGLFCTILGVLIASGAASCGCFGASGPSPTAMLAIDAALLVGLLVFRPRGQRTSLADGLRRTAILLPVPLLVAVGIAFGVPKKAGISLAPPEPGTTEPATATNTNTTKPTDATSAPAGPTAKANAWPAPPATAKPWYAPEFDTWKGQRLDAQEVMLLIPRPLPANLNEGRHHIVLMREDCDHCHELLTKYFSGKLETPTLTLAVPDATGELLENPCVECGKSTFPKGITYVFSTPVLLTVQDGVVVGVCTNSEDADLVRAALNAK